MQSLVRKKKENKTEKKTKETGTAQCCAKTSKIVVGCHD